LSNMQVSSLHTIHKDRLWRKPGTPGGKTTKEGGCCPIC
jgi:hypothetical protein